MQPRGKEMMSQEYHAWPVKMNLLFVSFSILQARGVYMTVHMFPYMLMVIFIELCMFLIPNSILTLHALH